jgi:hypothetical protein
MSSIRIRPRFKLSNDNTSEEILGKIRLSLNDGNCDFYAESLLNNFVIIKMKAEHQRFWSPQLSISIDKTASGCVLRGLYAPRPTIWSFFIFLYTGIGVGVLFSGLYGLARISLNLQAPILWLLPVLLGFALFLYLLAQAGQKFSAQQMFDIHHFFEKSIGVKIRIY